MKKTISILFLTFLAFGFGSRSENVDLPIGDQLSCTPPNTPGIPNITTDNQNYIHASAFSLGGADGYEWTVTNGFIISGQGTSFISIGPDCPVPSSIEVCVRAYNGNCYSAQRCATLSYSGPCFLL